MKIVKVGIFICKGCWKGSDKSKYNNLYYRQEEYMLEEIFKAIVSSPLGKEIDVEACEHNEYFIVLHFADGRRHMLTCPNLE